MLKQYAIELLYDGGIYPITFHGDSEGDCNFQAIKWCMENCGEANKDWKIVKDEILEDTSLEHFWGLDKVN